MSLSKAPLVAMSLTMTKSSFSFVCLHELLSVIIKPGDLENIQNILNVRLIQAKGHDGAGLI